MVEYDKIGLKDAKWLHGWDGKVFDWDGCRNTGWFWASEETLDRSTTTPFSISKE